MTFKLKDLEVDDLMTRNVVSVRASEPLSTVAKLLWDGGTMRSGQVRRLPVLDSERKLVGILSTTDIARVARERSATRPGFDISPFQVIDTLNLITNDRSNSSGWTVQRALTHGDQMQHQAVKCQVDDTGVATHNFGAAIAFLSAPGGCHENLRCLRCA